MPSKQLHSGHCGPNCPGHRAHYHCGSDTGDHHSALQENEVSAQRTHNYSLHVLNVLVCNSYAGIRPCRALAIQECRNSRYHNNYALYILSLKYNSGDTSQLQVSYRLMAILSLCFYVTGRGSSLIIVRVLMKFQLYKLSLSLKFLKNLTLSLAIRLYNYVY